MKRIILSFLLVILFSGIAFAQKSITLVVIGEGASKDEAIYSALRSAIEQSYGTFVSSNTTILDDDLVKDEIVSISSGNIQKYKELSNVVLPNGRFMTTIEAIVSLSKLTNYAQSKGAECELAGATIAANLRLADFYAKSEAEAISHMIIELRALVPALYDYSLKILNPKPDGSYYNIPFIINISANEASKQFCNTIVNTLVALSMDAKAASSYESITGEAPVKVKILNEKMGIFVDSDKTLLLRNPESVKLIRSFFNDEVRPSLDYEIEDNNGNVYHEENYGVVDGQGKVRYPYRNNLKREHGPYATAPERPIRTDQRYDPCYYIKNILNCTVYEFDYHLIIPKDDIGKYATFTIRKRPK